MGVFSDDFAAVDVREDYANLSLTEKANSRGAMNGNKTNKEKVMRGGKSGSRSPSGSAGAAPHRRAFRFGFPCCLVVFFVACAWLRRREVPPHSSMPSTRHGANCNILAMSEESNHIYYCVVSLRNHVVKSEFAYVNPVIVGNDDDQNKILRQY